MQEPIHEEIVLQLQPSGRSMPAAGPLASCVQPGQFVEDGSKSYYLKLDYNIASHQKPPARNYFFKKDPCISFLQLLVGLIIILGFGGS